MKAHTRSSFHRITKLFLIWRLWLCIPLLVAAYVLPYRAEMSYTSLWHYTGTYFPASLPIFGPLANFDGVHYMGIASRGYVDEARFLPFYPALVSGVGHVLALGDSVPYAQAYFWAGTIVSTLCFMSALVLLYKLFILDVSTKVAHLAIASLLAFPTAFYFVALYSESLFFLLSVICLYAVRRSSWMAAVVTAALLSITRLPGVLVGGVVAWGMLVKREQVWRWLQLLIIPLPLVGYVYFNWLHWGDPLFFVHAHGALGNSRETAGAVFPLVTVWRYIKIFMSIPPAQYEFSIALLELASVTVAWIGISVMARMTYLRKLHPTYVLYSIAVLILPTLSGTFSGFPRYMASAFPLFLVFAMLMHKRTQVTWTLVGLSLCLQAVLLMLFARGYYVA